MKRDNTIDVLKGIGIVLMVFRHTRAPYSEFVLLFHMAIFFIASGYLYKQVTDKNIKSFFNFALRKAKGLWIPYVLYCSIFIVCTNLLIKIGFYTDNSLIAQIPGNVVFSYVGMKKLLIKICKVFFFMGEPQLCGALWFFQVLFFVIIAYAFVDWLLAHNDTMLRYRVVIQFCISVVFLIIGYIMFKNNIKVKGLERVLSVYWLIYLGNIIKKYNIVRVFDKTWIGLLSVVISFVSLLILFQYGEISIADNSICNPAFYISCSCFGFILTYNVSKLIIQFVPFMEKIFAYISIHSIPIISLHFLCFKLVSSVIVVIYGLDHYMLACFPVISIEGYWWIAYLLVGIVIPLIVDICYSMGRSIIKR